MQENLNVWLTEAEVEQWISRYHFEESDLFDLLQKKRKVELAIKIHVYYEWETEMKIAGIITLGKELDLLLEQTMKAGNLRDAYMIECIAMESLQKAYEEFAKFIYNQYQKQVEEFLFFGESDPLEKIAAVFERLKQTEVTYNEAYMMTPLKSVCCYVKLGEKREKCGFNLCQSCNNKKCDSRK